jgi:hypothetical protein
MQLRGRVQRTRRWGESPLRIDPHRQSEVPQASVRHLVRDGWLDVPDLLAGRYEMSATGTEVHPAAQGKLSFFGIVVRHIAVVLLLGVENDEDILTPFWHSREASEHPVYPLHRALHIVEDCACFAHSERGYHGRVCRLLQLVSGSERVAKVQQPRALACPPCTGARPRRQRLHPCVRRVPIKKRVTIEALNVGKQGPLGVRGAHEARRGVAPGALTTPGRKLDKGK